MVALTKPAAQVAAIRTLPGDSRKAAREFAERSPVETCPIYGKHEEKFGSRVKHKRGTPGLQDWPAWAWQKASGWGFMSCDPRFKPIDFDNLAAYERLIEPIPCLKETYTAQPFRGFHLLVYTAYPLPD